MAQQKTGAKKRTSAKERQAAAEAKEREERYHRQFCALGLFAAGIFLFALCMVKGSKLWTVLHDAMFGLFGWCAILVPTALVYIAVMQTMNKGKIQHKAWQTGALIMLLCAITHAFTMADMEPESFVDGIKLLYDGGKELQGGGLCAGLIGMPFTAMFGSLGAKITLFLLTFLLLMIITGTTLSQFAKGAYHPVKKMEEAYIERVEERRAQAAVAGARFNIDVPLPKEELPQHPVQAPKSKMEYTDSIKLAKDRLVGFDDDEPDWEQSAPPPRKSAPVRQEDKNGIDDIINKAMGLEANDFKPVYISDEDAQQGVISTLSRSGRTRSQSTSNASFLDAEPPMPASASQPSAPAAASAPEATLDREEPDEGEREVFFPLKRRDSAPAVVDAEVLPVSPVNSLPEEPVLDAYEMLQRALAEDPEPIVTEPLVDGRFQATFTDDDGKEGFDAYIFPPVSLLKESKVEVGEDISEELKANAQRLVDTLNSFGVQTRIIDICRGPAVTRYELQPSAGVKISKITGLADDIALNLAAAGVRIEAPIPNKAAVGIEVPNKIVSMVSIREIIDSDAFMDAQSKLTVSLGKDISGSIATTDLAKMPHLLIAGATGSGKSVCINSLIVSLLYKSTPDQVRLLMIDPKVVELGIYNGIPHLLVPVVTDPRKAAGALNWAVSEMLNRYKMFAENSVRDLKGYNKLARQDDNPLKPMPEIVIVIDELADLMMAAPNEVEDAVCRLAQMARAAGMHLVIATQRPSVDVITGVIKANIPSRIAFAVSSQVDSRTILDGGGAEKLLGRGDMLFFPVGASKPTRVQGCYVSDKEVEKVVKFIKESQSSEYDEEIMSEIERQAVAEKGKGSSGGGDGGGFDADDEMLARAIEVVVEGGQASTSLLQRRLKLGYARAARIVDEMEQRGIVGPFEGSKPRPVLITRQQWIEMKMAQSEGEN